MMNCEKLLKGIEETLQYDILKPSCDEKSEENYLNWLLEQAPLRLRSEKTRFKNAFFNFLKLKILTLV